MGEEDTMDERAPEPTGAQLRRAREAASLSLEQVAAITRIRTSHLQALEDGDLAALPGRTYAIGFARTYAKAVGLDDAVIARLIRRDLGDAAAPSETAGTPAFTPGDPARVPTARFAWIAAGVAVVLAVAGFAFWQTSQGPSASLPSLLPDTTATPVSAPAIAPAAPVGGPVVFAALASGVVVKLTDGSGQVLLARQLAQGESFAIPADAVRPLLSTSSPDALAITVGGRPVAKLAESHTAVENVEVSAQALLARVAPPVVAPAVTVAPAPAPAAVAMAGAAVAKPLVAAAASRPARKVVPARKAAVTDGDARLGGILPPPVEPAKPGDDAASAKPTGAVPAP